MLRIEDAGEPATVRGEVVGADDDAVTLATPTARLRVPLAEVDHGKVVLPW